MMKLDRRTYLAGVGASIAALAGCSSRTAQVAEDDDVPEEVVSVRPLAQALHEALREHYTVASVWIEETGEQLVVDYATEQQSPEELEAELYQIGELYADVLREGEYTPVTVSIITQEVQAIVTADAAAAYIDDRLEQDAYHETIEVTSVERAE